MKKEIVKELQEQHKTIRGLIDYLKNIDIDTFECPLESLLFTIYYCGVSDGATNVVNNAASAIHQCMDSIHHPDYNNHMGEFPIFKDDHVPTEESNNDYIISRHTDKEAHESAGGFYK